MADGNDHLSGLNTASRDRLEEVAGRFEDAWQRGPRPDLRAFAPPGQATPALLLELALIDLEYRLKGGEPVRVETYLEWCPELSADRGAVVALVRAEYERRRLAEPRLNADEYRARFPQYADELTTLGNRPDAAPTPRIEPGSATGDLPSTLAHMAGTTSAGGARPGQGGAGAEAGLPSLPGYEVLEVIGRGGMGVVLKARHRPLNRLVALKLPLPHLTASAADRERFVREARSAARLRHPHICPIYEVGEFPCPDGLPAGSAGLGGRPYLAMGFIRGETLKAWTARIQPTARQAAELVAALARAVAYAHDQGVIHRDLKPTNVIVDADTGKPVLTDFGLAKELAEHAAEMTQSGQILGTPAYMAPEQAAGRAHEVGPAADVYALGVVLYELLTGRLPFEGSVGEILHKVQTDEPPAPRKLAPRVHRDLETVCLRALAKAPAGRYASAAALADDLDRFCAGEAILARREGAAARLWRKVRRRPAAAAALATGVLAAVAIVFTVAVLRAMHSSEEVSALRKEYAARVAPPGQPAAFLAAAEALLARQGELDALRAEVARLDPAEADALPRPEERVAVLLREYWRLRVNPDEVKRIEDTIVALTARNGTLGQALDAEFRNRKKQRQAAFDLNPAHPANGAGTPEEVFGAPAPQIVAKGLARPAGRPGPVVLTRIRCQGDVQLEALFDAPSWEDATELGLLLNAGPGGAKGYHFVLRTLPLPPDPRSKTAGTTPTFGAARRLAEGTVSLQIRHGNDRLREQRLQASVVLPKQLDDRLYLKAARAGNHLMFQVNKRPPLRFQDALLLSGGEPGVFGLHWPPGVRLAHVWALEQAVAAAAGPLDLGDHLYNQDRLAEAQVEYRKVAQAAPEPRLRQEARYKEALCLLRSNDHPKAAELFEQVLAMPGGQRTAGAKHSADAVAWDLLAKCQLWLIALRQKNYDRADELYQVIRLEHELEKVEKVEKFEKLALVVPEDLRDEIRRACRPDGGVNPFRVEPSRLNVLDLAVKIGDLFDASEGDRFLARWDLFLACSAAGRIDQALRAADEAFRIHPAWAWTMFVLPEHYSWLLRQRDPRRALAFLDALPPETSKLPPERQGLQVERVRTLAALGRTADAERCLDEYFARLPPYVEPTSYQWYGEAWLLRGFLREARGDQKGAEEAWRKGTYRAWRQLVLDSDAGKKAPLKEKFFGLGTTRPTLCAAITGSLAGDMSDDEANVFIDGAIHLVGTNTPVALMQQLGLRPSPALVRGLWRDGRGRDRARQIALQSVSYAETIRAPVLLIGVGLLRERALTGPPTREQEAVLWQLTEEMTKADSSELWKLGPPLIVTLRGGGPANPLGWKALAPTLRPAMRGPLAYFFGCRYLNVLNRPRDAEPFFAAALKDAPASSDLERVARAGLDQARMK